MNQLNHHTRSVSPLRINEDRSLAAAVRGAWFGGQLGCFLGCPVWPEAVQSQSLPRVELHCLTRTPAVRRSRRGCSPPPSLEHDRRRSSSGLRGSKNGAVGDAVSKVEGSSRGTIGPVGSFFLDHPSIEQLVQPRKYELTSELDPKRRYLAALG